MDKILILDFGSQYTQLIARRIRELQVYCEIHPFHLSFEKISSFGAKAIILSGGPASVMEENAPTIDPKIFELGLPILGICYGMQLITKLLGGKLGRATHREYGRSIFNLTDNCELFNGVAAQSQVWMSHGDSIIELPKDFIKSGDSSNAPFAAMANTAKKIYALQFHPEVVHTESGTAILKNFIFNIAGCKADWNMSNFVEREVTRLQAQIGNERVLCAVSGGVDSTVTAVLLHKAIGDRVQCIFIDNGLLRKDEAKKVVNMFEKHWHIPLKFVDATERFLTKLAGISDPEQKRKIIGNEFIYLFEDEAKKFAGVGFKFLAQGTLYPDVIESVSTKGPSAVIKSHHNVGGLPENMQFKLVEPLRELFKDEVRVLGEELGISRELTKRHPFPGPGLAVRILGDITAEKTRILQEADDIIVSEIKAAGLYDQIWQVFGVLLPVRTVGVMGDERTYGQVIAIRAVTSSDGMTADWVHLPQEVLAKMSNRIINEVREINRVVLDITSKPPGTIEWE